METLEAIFACKSIREYTPQTVPDELVQELLAAAICRFTWLPSSQA